MQREPHILLLITLAFVLIGILMVYSASIVDPHSEGRLFRQTLYASAGVGLLLLLAHFDYRAFRRPVLFRAVVLFSLALLVLVLIPGIGVERNGARRWIEVFGFTFQPSEVAKFAVILLLAVKLADNQQEIRSFVRGYLPPIGIAGLFAVFIFFEKDLGVPIVIFAVAFFMMLVAGVRWMYIVPSMIPGFLVVLAVSIISPHRVRRLLAFLNPWEHSDDESFQLIQSFAAFAHGGVWGMGPGGSEQKLHYLPAAHTDFIFAIWGEEMGLVGSLTMVALFGAIVYVGSRIALNARDLFGTLLAAGITSLIAFQAAFNIAVTVGLLPTKGLPLPFVSWGGSALLMTLAMVGVLINVGLQGEPAENAGQLAAARA